MGYNKSNNTISGLFKAINDNFTCMSITLPEDKKKVLDKEIKAVDAKLEVLVNFDNSLKAVDGWKDTATAELKDIKEASGAMLPEDRVARTMDLQEDIAAKLEILKGCAATELALLPQGSGVDAHAQAFKDELNRITDYSPSLLLTPRLSATSTPTMSSSGPSTEPESRSTLPGWLVPRRPLLRVFPSPPTSTRSRPCTRRCPPSTRPALPTPRFWMPPMNMDSAAMHSFSYLYVCCVYTHICNYT